MHMRTSPQKPTVRMSGGEGEEFMRCAGQRYRLPGECYRMAGQCFRVSDEYVRVPDEHFSVPDEHFRVPDECFRVSDECFREPEEYFQELGGHSSGSGRMVSSTRRRFLKGRKAVNSLGRGIMPDGGLKTGPELALVGAVLRIRANQRMKGCLDRTTIYCGWRSLRIPQIALAFGEWSRILGGVRR